MTTVNRIARPERHRRARGAAAIAGAFGVAAAFAGPGRPSPTPPPETRVVHVVAERFSFTPSEIRVPLGTTLELRLTSDDTNHGFRLAGTDIDVLVPKRGRGETVVRFTPERAGRYAFECSRLCGAGHNFMRGEIVVVEGRTDAR
jgi:cytochrome c oxidase subunit 2